MSNWIKVMNSMPSHPKVLLAGDRASWLYVCGLCYANEHLTDGYIARHVLVIVAPNVARPERLAASLVDAGLWHKVDGGWRIHDYGEVQSSAEDIRSQREKDRRRKQDARAASNGSPRGQIADSERIPSGVHDVEKRREDKGRDNVNSNVGPRPDRGPSAEDLQAVFDAWIEATGKTDKTVFDEKRKRRIKAAYKLGFDRDELCDAVRGWRNSPHHRGENDSGTVYNDLDLLLRDSAHIEKFRDLQRRPLNLAARTGQVESSSDFLARRGWA